MAFLRAFFLLLLLTTAGLFVCFVATGEPRFKRYGFQVLLWTLVAAFGFFGVLILERIA